MVEDGKESQTIQAYLPKDQRKYYQEFRKTIEPAISKTIQDEFPSIKVEFEEPKKDMQSSIQSLIQALISSLVILALLLLWEFRSYRATVLVFSVIPVAFGGAFLSLYVFQSTLSLNSMLGLILLGGVSVNNSILLLDFYGRSRTEGLSHWDAIIRSASLRIRPILMTSLTTFFGMLPIALGYGAGGAVLQPLGIAVAGGVLISTTLMLVFVPCLLFYLGEKT
jgi:multidrug efflux pump subunit AcrB